MRHSNHTVGSGRLSTWALGLLAMIVVGCSQTAAASVPPTIAPTPLITPDPHLKEPVTADQLYSLLAQAKLGIVPNNANLGRGNPLIVKQINADLHSWPLRITQYRSAEALKKALAWKAGEAPGADETPYAFAGLNVLVEFGPSNARTPAVPDKTRQDAAASIVAILDPLLWPLSQHSVAPVATRTPESTAAPPASARPTLQPTKKPKPSKTP